MGSACAISGPPQTRRPSRLSAGPSTARDPGPPMPDVSHLLFFPSLPRPSFFSENVNMAANTAPYANANAHSATIDAAAYKVRELDIELGGQTEDAMTGDDAGWENPQPVSKGCRVNAMIMVPAASTPN